MFFVTVFSISAEQQAAIDRLKVRWSLFYLVEGGSQLDCLKGVIDRLKVLMGKLSSVKRSPMEEFAMQRRGTVWFLF